MIQDILPHVFDNQFSQKPVAPEDFLLVYSGGNVLAKQIENQLILPKFQDLQVEPDWCVYGFGLDQAHFYVLRRNAPPAPEGWQYLPSRACRTMLPQEIAFCCGVGESLSRWHRGNQFCGCCGTEMADSDFERARVCPHCGNVVYPRICPAVILAVHTDDRLLLSRYNTSSHTGYRGYALIAGYNEIGESIEQTVHREVMEEVGLRVKNLRFYKSQPWVFTDSLLMGFFAELDGSDEIILDVNELSQAEWFSRSALPTLHSDISLTGEMIEVFRQGKEPK